MRDRRQVRITYHVPSRDEDTERVVDPHAVLDLDHSAYLHAWCHRAEAPRFFRLDRIRQLDVLDTRAETEPSTAPDLSDGFFAADSEAQQVTLRLAPEASWVPEYYDVEVLRRRKDGSQDVRLRVADPAWLRRLLGRLTPHASVLDPNAVAEDFTDRAHATLSLYN